MRRVWLLLLALVLPLQAAWASAHGYAHDAAASHAAVAVTAAEAGTDSGADLHAGGKNHGCCDISHSCHGSPSLVPSRTPQAEAGAGSLLNPSSRALTPRILVSRLERPQWPAA